MSVQAEINALANEITNLRVQLARNDNVPLAVLVCLHSKKKGNKETVKAGHEVIFIPQDIKTYGQLKARIGDEFSKYSGKAKSDHTNFGDNTISWDESHEIKSIKAIWHCPGEWNGGEACTPSETNIHEDNMRSVFALIKAGAKFNALSVTVKVPAKEKQGKEKAKA